MSHKTEAEPNTRKAGVAVTKLNNPHPHPHPPKGKIPTENSHEKYDKNPGKKEKIRPQ